MGATGTNFHYDIYAFTNTTGADACVTVQLQSTSNLMAAAYLGSFNPNDISQNYLADAGSSTSAGSSNTTFSCTVPDGARFLVTVNEVDPNSGTQPYLLYLSGLPCPLPTLAIGPVTPATVRLHWPTWAGGYELETRPTVNPGAWSAITNEPIVQGGRYNVTNSATGNTKFYHLSKP